MGDMCDCDDCGGVRDCGCGPEPKAGSSCSNGYCEVTSQSTGASRMRTTTMNRNAARMFRGTHLAAYDELSLRVGPDTARNGPMAVAAMTGDPLPPSLNLMTINGYPTYVPAGQPIQGQPGDTPQQQAARRLLAYINGWTLARMRSPSSAEKAVIRPLQQAMGGITADGQVGTNTANRIVQLLNYAIPGLATTPVIPMMTQPSPQPQPQGTKTGGEQVQIRYEQPPQSGQQPQGGQQPHGGGMAPEVQQALINLGTTGLQGLTGVISTALQQGGQTDRTRIEADYRRDVAGLQARGLLTQQQAADALSAFQNASANLSLIHLLRCRRIERFSSLWAPATLKNTME